MKKKSAYTRNTEALNKKTVVTSENNLNNNNSQPNKPAQPNISQLTIWIAAILIITLIAFWPTFNNEITNWDDDKYITDNPFFALKGSDAVSEIFFSNNLQKRYWMGNYHPLTMLSLNINYHLSHKDSKSEINPRSFQITNVILHLLSTLFVFLIIHLLFKNNTITIIATLLFGVHTLHVESITWISERKDVLYTLFYMCSLWLYIYKKRIICITV